MQLYCGGDKFTSQEVYQIPVHSISLPYLLTAEFAIDGLFTLYLRYLIPFLKDHPGGETSFLPFWIFTKPIYYDGLPPKNCINF